MDQNTAVGGRGKMDDLKKSYTQQLACYYKAEEYMDDNRVAEEEKDKHFDKFREIIRELNELAIQIELAGHKMSAQEIKKGFGI